MIKAFLVCCCVVIGSQLQAIHEHGYWEFNDSESEHIFDPNLSMALIDFFYEEQASTLVDFGCGKGDYVKAFKTCGFDVIGYDGNPNTIRWSDGLCRIIDLSEPFTLGETFDWVLSLEVGEHIPKKYETIFIENLHRHAKKGIVLSWAIKGQGGYGHVNTQNNEYIKALMASYGYTNDEAAERRLRLESSLPWFRNTIMVFRKSI